MKKDVHLRFWSKVNTDGPTIRPELGNCWEWTASIVGDYGTFGFNGKVCKAHRVSWILENGDIPLGLCVCHKCDNPSCVRPSHLWLGTHGENNTDRSNKGRSGKLFGDANNSRRFAHKLLRGDQTWARRFPEKLKRGEENPTSKLNNESIREIRRLNLQGVTQTQLAKVYSVTQASISGIVLRKVWKHI